MAESDIDHLVLPIKTIIKINFIVDSQSTNAQKLSATFTPDANITPELKLIECSGPINSTVYFKLLFPGKLKIVWETSATAFFTDIVVATGYFSQQYRWVKADACEIKFEV